MTGLAGETDPDLRCVIMPIMPRSIPLAFLAVTAAACGAPTHPSDPPATPVAAAAAPCPAPVTEGNRLILHDCEAPLAREYYLVSVDGEIASVLPQPDRHAALAALCDDPADLRDVLDRHGWCRHDIDRTHVNSMPTEDAVAMARGLHRHLRFTAIGRAVDPYPASGDVAELCAGVDPASDLGNACAAYGPHELENVYRPSPAGAVAMASALDRLYGIE